MYRGSLVTRVADEVAEVSTVQCRADSGDDLDGKYFVLYSANDAIKYHVWYDTPAGAGDPAPAGSTGIQVSIIQGETADNVATKTATAIDAVGAFGAVASTDTVTITNAANGITTDVADVDTTHAAFSVTTQGEDGDVTVAQPIKVHGYIIVSDGSNDANLKIWLNTKTGNPVWEDTVVGADLAKPVDFSAPLGIGVEGDSVIFEVIGGGGVAHVRYD